MHGELENIEARPSLFMDAPQSLLQAMLADWVQWCPGDSRGSTSRATLEALKRALVECELGQTAHDLHTDPSECITARHIYNIVELMLSQFEKPIIILKFDNFLY